MEIVLLRHGKPKSETQGKLTASEFGQWVAAYNMAGVDSTHAPSTSTIMKAKACSVAVCSNLPRSVESATVLGLENVEMQDPLFRECDIPYTEWNSLKLSVSGWSSVFRTLQILGYSSNAESFKAARQRAYRCALRLSDLAQEHESVLFVGHGMLNWLISKKLLRMGWLGPRNTGSNYWDYGVYRCDIV